MDWYKCWHGAATDIKWPAVAKIATDVRTLCDMSRTSVTIGTSSVMAVTWALMDHASRHIVRGNVTGFDVESFAIFSGLPEDEIRAVIMALEKKNVIKDNAFVNWAKHQSSSDAERKRKERARKKDAVMSHDVTDVTDASLLDKIKIKKESTPIVPKTPSSWTYTEDFERLWNSWRPFEMSKGGKGEASKSYAKALSSGVTSNVLEKAAIAYCRNCERLKSKTQHLSTWLNQRGWEGVEEPAPKSFYDNPMNRMPSPAGG